MYITLNDFLRTLLIVSASAAIIVLTIALCHVIRILKQVSKVLDDNKRNIDTTIGSLPETLKNVNEVMIDVKAITSKAGNVAGSVDQVVSGAISRAGDTAGNIVEIAKVIGESVKYVTGILGRRAPKKDRLDQ